MKDREIIADLRSDTITHPTPAMKSAMFEAPLGDDVLGDEPTVIRLQEKVAALLQKDAALFVPSGTMANQLAVRSQTEPGDEIITETGSHTFLYETGALAALCGVQPHLIDGKRGLIGPEEIEPAIREKNCHFPMSKLIILENTHNHGGGTVYPLPLLKEVKDLAISRGLKIHMDGARLWNASVASGHAPSEFSKYCDTVSVCLSKGLGAPVGSLLVGNRDTIQRAHRFRKMFGGGMRQSGLLAAAGIYALDNHVERLAQDHENAKFLAKELERIPEIEIDVDQVETNLVYFRCTSKTAPEFEHLLESRGVRVLAESKSLVRAVTHLDVTKHQIEQALEIFQEVLK